MDRDLHLKNKKFICERNILSKNLELSSRIVKSRVEKIENNANREKNEVLNKFVQSTFKSLDIFTRTFQKCNSEFGRSFLKIDFKKLDYPKCDLSGYKVNTIGDGVITNIKNVPQNYCHLNDIKRPQPALQNVVRNPVKKLPRPGEIFGISLGAKSLYRAIRNYRVSEEPDSICLYLIDRGETINVPIDLKKMISLPQEVQQIEPRAILCKILKITDENGKSMDVEKHLRIIANKPIYFQIKNIEKNTFWIDVFLKPSEKNRTSEARSNVMRNSSTRVANKDENNAIVTLTSTNNAKISNTSTKTETLKKIRRSDRINRSASNEPCKKPKTSGDYFETTKKPTECYNENNTNEETKPDLKFKCDICKREFSTKTEIENHMNLHKPKLKKKKNRAKNGITSAGPFTCRFCQKELVARKNLNEHLNLHLKTVPYACELCPKVFFHVNSFRYHKKVHSGVRNYKCKLCFRRFMTASKLKKHLTLTKKCGMPIKQMKNPRFFLKK